MGLKLYQDLLSQPTRSIWMFLKANEIPFEDIPVDLTKGEHLTEEFAKVNPLKKVPTIDHNGFCLAESLAIIRYIIRENCVPDHWYPKDSQKRARVDQYLSWHPMAVRDPTLTYFKEKAFLPKFTKAPVNEEKVKDAKERVEKSLDEIENLYLANTKFLSGDEISIADLFAISELEQPLCIGYDLKKDRKVLTAWMDRVKAKMEPYYSKAHERLHSNFK